MPKSRTLAKLPLTLLKLVFFHNIINLFFQVSIFPGDSAPCAEDHLPTISIPVPTKSESSNLTKTDTLGQARAESSNSARAEMVVEVHTSEKEEYEIHKERRRSSGCARHLLIFLNYFFDEV